MIIELDLSTESACILTRALLDYSREQDFRATKCIYCVRKLDEYDFDDNSESSDPERKQTLTQRYLRDADSASKKRSEALLLRGAIIRNMGLGQDR